jgi:hypothetical protein
VREALPCLEHRRYAVVQPHTHPNTTTMTVRPREDVP